MTTEEAAILCSIVLGQPDISAWFTDTNLARLVALRPFRPEWMKLYVEAKRQRMEKELLAAIEERENMSRMTDVVHFSELDDLEEDDWLVDQLVRRKSLSIIAGDPKAGKSTLVTQMIAMMLLGRTFVDRKCQPCRVLYYSLEEIGAEVKAKFMAYGLTDQPLYVREGYVPPSTFSQTLREDIANHQADFVLIDPLFDSLEVEGTNDYVPLNRALKEMLYVARGTGAHVCCIHHANKGGGILGSQSIRASTDFNMYMKIDEKTEGRYCYSENRYGEALNKYWARLQPDKTLRFEPKES